MRSLEGKKGVVNEGVGGRESVPAMVQGMTDGTITARQCGPTDISFFDSKVRLNSPTRNDKVGPLDKYNLVEIEMDILITQSSGDKQ